MAGLRTKDERFDQCDVLEKSLLRGQNPTMAVRAYAKKFRLSIRTAWRDYQWVRARWRRQAAREAPHAFGLALARREDLIGEAMDAGDIRLAFEIEVDRCNLLGLYPAAPNPDSAKLYFDGRVYRPFKKRGPRKVAATPASEVATDAGALPVAKSGTGSGRLPAGVSDAAANAG